MGIPEIIQDLQPLRGQVTPIRTTQETQPVEEFGKSAPSHTSFHRDLAHQAVGDAYVAEVNVKSASKVVK